ncbi:MAG: 2-amino-4-hydroxy-6-hydroxymethyldihydropteridine diphosphokinase [Longimicrobiales bacterium]|nr:2-amino-4-hydroxy-6-hydroxymethyldihydropteridine diphosphokinase [Longimicrobiales bacterium]
MTDAWLGLGANLGDRRATLLRALDLLGEHGEVLERSAFIETEPVGAEGPDYLNAVCRLATELAPRELLDATQAIEAALGRDPAAKGTGAPRPIDIDLLLYGDRRVDEPGLVIPHPRLHERAFVLEPLASLAPGLVHPVLGVTVGALAEGIG